MARNFTVASTDKLTSANTYSFNGNFSCSCWFNTTNSGVGASNGIWASSTGGTYGMGFDSGGLVCNLGAAGETGMGFTVSNNTWVQAGFTGNFSSSAQTFKFYVNGSNTGSASVTTNTSSPKILGGSDAFGSVLNGKLSDLAFWNVILTLTEYQGLARGIRPNKIRPQSLNFWWPIDGLQSPEPDLSGNANNGTVGGSPAFALGPPVTLFTPRWPMVTPSVTPLPLMMFNMLIPVVATVSLTVHS